MPAVRRTALVCLLFLLSACAGQQQDSAPPFLPATPPSAPPLHVFPATRVLRVGQSASVLAAFYDGDERIDGVVLSATLDDASVASFDAGKVTGLRAGKTTLHLAAKEPVESTVDVAVVVRDDDPVALTIEPIAPARIGERVHAQATAHMADGSTWDATYDADWSVSPETDAAVATADIERGDVVSLTAKPVIVSATLGALQASTQLATRGGAPVGIEVRHAWSYGDKRRFAAYARYADGEVREVTAGCSWRVDDGAAWRGIARAPQGPWVDASELSWDRTATCVLAGTAGKAALFAP